MFGGTVSVGDPYVDTSVVGDIDGYGGQVNVTGQNIRSSDNGLQFTRRNCEPRRYAR